MRHTATIELLEGEEVHDKLFYFSEMSSKKELTYDDIMSAGRDKTISAYFSTDDGDSGRVIFEDKVIRLSVDLSFDRLIELYNFTQTYYEEKVVDLIRKETDPDYPPSNSEPIETA